MVSIRTTKVGAKEYLQVVEYYTENGQSKVRVLKSFGEANLLNRLLAVQFKASYEALKIFKQDASVQGADDLSTVVNIALATFGAILGVKFIKDYFDNNQ